MPFSRFSMRADVKRVLLEKILDGTYKPGQRLVELQIARDLDVSQGPVREALRDLEGLGVVESQHYRGTRVRSISEREIKEALQIRGVRRIGRSTGSTKTKGKRQVS
jgi:DNA-binding GntR family transcriptional regulator